MSAIASLWVVDRAAVADQVLPVPGRDLSDLFSWSGYCMLDLLTFLDERGIVSTEPDPSALRDSDAFVAVFGPGDHVLLDRLDPRAFRSEELVEAMSGFDFDDTEAVLAATDGLEALRTGIGALGDHDLLMVRIG